MQLDLFDEAAQDAFQEAQEIMHNCRQADLDVEHIFLALLRRPDGMTGRVLERLGADISVVLQRVEQELEKPPKNYNQYQYGPQIYITPRLQRLIKRSKEQADQFNDRYICVEHLLIAIGGEREGTSAKILQTFNISQERILAALEAVRRPSNALESERRAPAPDESNQQIRALEARVAALELQNQHFQEHLNMIQEYLAHIRERLDEIAQRHRAEQHGAAASAEEQPAR